MFWNKKNKSFSNKKIDFNKLVVGCVSSGKCRDNKSFILNNLSKTEETIIWAIKNSSNRQ